jgi:nucleoid-associated protein YgaU
MPTEVTLVRSVRLITVLVVAVVAAVGIMWPRAASAAIDLDAQAATYQPVHHAGSAYFITKPAPRKVFVKPKRVVRPMVVHHPKKIVQPKKVACKFVYVVKKGDTLSAIAARFHTTTHRLAQVNKIRNPNLIFIGQRLCIA